MSRMGADHDEETLVKRKLPSVYLQAKKLQNNAQVTYDEEESLRLSPTHILNNCVYSKM